MLYSNWTHSTGTPNLTIGSYIANFSLIGRHMASMLNQNHFRCPGSHSCIPEPLNYRNFNQVVVLHNKFQITRGTPVYEKRETRL